METCAFDYKNLSRAGDHVTWEREDQRSAIGFFLVNKEARMTVLNFNVDVEMEFDIGSDHRTGFVPYRQSSSAEREGSHSSCKGEGKERWRTKALTGEVQGRLWRRVLVWSNEQKD